MSARYAAMRAVYGALHGEGAAYDARLAFSCVNLSYDYDDADDVAVSRSFAEGSARSSAGRRGGWVRQRRHARPRRAHRHSHAELTVVASRAGDDHKFEPPPVLSLESYASKESEAQVASKKRIGSGKARGGNGAKAEEERAQARQQRYMRLARGLVP